MNDISTLSYILDNFPFNEPMSKNDLRAKKIPEVAFLNLVEQNIFRKLSKELWARKNSEFTTNGMIRYVLNRYTNIYSGGTFRLIQWGIYTYHNHSFKTSGSQSQHSLNPSTNSDELPKIPYTFLLPGDENFARYWDPLNDWFTKEWGIAIKRDTLFNFKNIESPICYEGCISTRNLLYPYPKDNAWLDLVSDRISFGSCFEKALFEHFWFNPNLQAEIVFQKLKPHLERLTRFPVKNYPTYIPKSLANIHSNIEISPSLDYKIIDFLLERCTDESVKKKIETIIHLIDEHFTDTKNKTKTTYINH